MDDSVSATDSSATGMGSATTGYAVLPAGTQQMWQNEYFYLDGSVTLTVNERGADYGLSVFPSTWDAAEKDITTGPAQGAERYGLVRDTGKDDTPVPRWLTTRPPPTRRRSPRSPGCSTTALVRPPRRVGRPQRAEHVHPVRGDRVNAIPARRRIERRVSGVQTEIR